MVFDALSMLGKGNNDAEAALIPGDDWIDKLKFAFHEADLGNKGAVTMEEWMGSRLRFVVSNEKLTDEAFREFFLQVDANGDNVITWHELADYLMGQQRSMNSAGFDKKLRLVNIGPDLGKTRKYKRTTRCLRVMFIGYLEQMASLTQSALSFWTWNYELERQFTDTGEFVDFCYLKTQVRLAIAKATRCVIFYDLKTHTKLPFYVSATIDRTIIPKLSLRQSRKIMTRMRKEQSPLFHIPTAIEATFDEPLFYVGDQEGRIEVFKVFLSPIDNFTWEVERVGQRKIHKAAVTQIRHVPDLDGFVSSSDDGEIIIWTFREETASFLISYQFSVPGNLSIPMFVYDNRTNSIVFATSAHTLGCWKVYTNQRVFKDVPHSQTISAMASVQISQDASFIVTVSENKFFSTYIAPALELTGNWPLPYHHSLCAPTNAFFMKGNLYLVGSYLSCWQCQSADCDGLQPHVGHVVAALANDVFARVISCDDRGDMLNWEFANGKRSLHFELEEKDATLNCMQSDQLGRRLVLGYSNGTVKVLAASSGSVLASADKGVVNNGCNWCVFATLDKKRYIVAANGEKQIMLFEDSIGEKLVFLKSYRSHQELISRLVTLKDEYLLSIGMGHEMFLWDGKINIPCLRFEVPNNPTCATDTCLPDRFAVGDVAGLIHIMSLTMPTPIQTVNPFGMSKVIPITAITATKVAPFLAVGNRYGYIRMIQIKEESLILRPLFRGHPEAIEALSVSEKYQFVVSCGRDDEIRLWFIHPFGYIGELGKHRKWEIGDKSTWPEKPLDLDPKDFSAPEQLDDSDHEISRFETASSTPQIEPEPALAKSDEKSSYEPITGIQSFSQLMEELEALCNTGRERDYMIEQHNRITKRSGPSPTKLMCYDDFVTERELENTSQTLTKLRSTKFQRKFKLPKK